MIITIVHLHSTLCVSHKRILTKFICAKHCEMCSFSLSPLAHFVSNKLPSVLHGFSLCFHSIILNAKRSTWPTFFGLCLKIPNRKRQQSLCVPPLKFIYAKQQARAREWSALAETRTAKPPMKPYTCQIAPNSNEGIIYLYIFLYIFIFRLNFSL